MLAAGRVTDALDDYERSIPLVYPPNPRYEVHCDEDFQGPRRADVPPRAGTPGAPLRPPLMLDPRALSACRERAQIRTDQFLAIQAYLSFRKPDSMERKRLARCLVDRALEHNRPLLLWQLAGEKLAADKVMRPGVNVLERMIVTARRRAEHDTLGRLAVVLDGSGRSLLDGLLIPDRLTGQTPLSWLRRGEVTNTPAAILAALERRAALLGWGVDRWAGKRPLRPINA